jgi:hypothetical protein
MHVITMSVALEKGCPHKFVCIQDTTHQTTARKLPFTFCLAKFLMMEH